ncbi:MAG TPA: hypothetical protein VMW15_03000 [Terracidiphilus sp.]|nr:hypothetical protein [Terracidiphilus sp.]
MKFAAALAATISLALLSGCGSSGSTSVIQPVQAQSGYSNASITGTYSATFITGANGANSIGSFVADGNGHITSGALVFSDISSTCTGTFSGTYSLSSSASGTASLTFVVPSCATFNYSKADNFIIQAGASGASFFAQPLPPSDNAFHIVASKQ